MFPYKVFVIHCVSFLRACVCGREVREWEEEGRREERGRGGEKIKEGGGKEGGLGR